MNSSTSVFTLFRKNNHSVFYHNKHISRFIENIFETRRSKWRCLGLTEYFIKFTISHKFEINILTSRLYMLPTTEDAEVNKISVTISVNKF